MFNRYAEMSKYSWLLRQLIYRDIKIKYKRSYLGYLWTLLHPLMMMVVLTIVFSHIFKFQIDNFPMYLITGQVMFNFFAESTNMAMPSIIQSSGLIKQVYIPKFIIPLSKVLSSLINLGFSLVAVMIVMVVTGATINFSIILFPIPIIYLFFISLGMSLLLATAAVYFKDIIYLYSIFIQILCYLTPLFYPVEVLPTKVQFLLNFNPLFHIVNYFRKVVLYGDLPTIMDNIVCIAFVVIFMILGIVIFRKFQRNFLLHI